MAADLHIHVFEEGTLTDDDFREFFCSTLGSKWWDMDMSINDKTNFDGPVGRSPSVWVGHGCAWSDQYHGV